MTLGEFRTRCAYANYKKKREKVRIVLIAKLHRTVNAAFRVDANLSEIQKIHTYVTKLDLTITVDCCLMSSGKYFMHNQDENTLSNNNS